MQSLLTIALTWRDSSFTLPRMYLDMESAGPNSSIQK